MSKKEYQAWMVEAGWTREVAKPDPIYVMDLDDRRLESIPQFKTVGGAFIFTDNGQVWVDEWASVRHQIFPKFPKKNCALVRRRNSRNKTDGKGSAAYIAEITNELTAWAKGIDVDAEIANHAQDSEQYGLRAFDHITALAMRGDVEALQRWSAMDEDPRNQKLHPMVTPDALKQAVEIAKNYTSN